MIDSLPLVSPITTEQTHNYSNKIVNGNGKLLNQVVIAVPVSVAKVQLRRFVSPLTRFLNTAASDLAADSPYFTKLLWEPIVQKAMANY